MSAALKPIEVFRGDLTKLESQFKMALPSHVAPDRFIRVVMTAVQKMPALLDCDRTSLFSAAMFAAQDGLLPDGREGAIIPFGSRAQWMPMTAGLLKKIRNSGEVLDADAQIVREGEVFEYWITGKETHFKHIPNVFDTEATPKAVYAFVRTKSGGFYPDVLSATDVAKARAVSKTANRADSTWNQWTDEMWKKTAIRRLSKKCPMSTDILDLIRRDDEMYELRRDAVAASSPAPTTKGPARLSKIVESTLTEDEKFPFEKEGLTEPFDADEAS